SRTGLFRADIDIDAARPIRGPVIAIVRRPAVTRSCKLTRDPSPRRKARPPLVVNQEVVGHELPTAAFVRLKELEGSDPGVSDDDEGRAYVRSQDLVEGT